MTAMVHVQAPSRLHFGLLSLPAGDSWPGQQRETRLSWRSFGGVGLMVQKPGVGVGVGPAAAWSAEGPLAQRALEYGRRFAATVSPDAGGCAIGPRHLVVKQCPPEHAGLGTGTQLTLAVARALAVSWGLPAFDVVQLALQIGRGRRSALGIHGFAQGGFLVEAGKRGPEQIAPLVARLAFPEEWRLVLVLPTGEKGLHGLDENQAFERLRGKGMSRARTERLCRLVLLGMLPALAERDWQTFGESLHEFNSLVGETFAAVQGGIYASPHIAELVAFIRKQNITGVGQSSWGPTVFAVAQDEEQAQDLVTRLRKYFGLAAFEVWSTGACNHGARSTASTSSAND